MVILASGCQPETNKIIYLNAQRIDTVHFKYKNEEIICNVEVNKESFDFTFDTGASNTALGNGIGYSNIVENKSFMDARGISHQAKGVMLDSLTIGHRLFSKFDSYYHVSPLDKDGIIGGNILKAFAWKINFADQIITFSENAENLGVTGEGIPLIVHKDVPYVGITVDNETFMFLVDTGFSVFMLLKKNLSSKDELGEMVQWTENSLYNTPFSDKQDFIDTSYYHIEDISIQDQILKDEIIVYTSFTNFNLIGMDFLRRFEYVIIDYPGKKLYLGPRVFKSFRYVSTVLEKINTVGLQVENSPVHKVIAVWDSLAFQNGIAPGDTILAINGISLEEQPEAFYKDEIKSVDGGYTVSPSQWNQLSSALHFSDTSVNLKIKRHSNYQEVTLNRRFYFQDLPDTIQTNNSWNVSRQIPGTLGPKISKGNFLFFPKQ